jgi:pimeloyl-ACP methyl ester carboxylesterase
LKLEILEYLPAENRDLPPLLFVHGGSHAAWCWKEHFLPYFSAQGFPAYALSFRGHGASEGRENLASFTLSDYVDDVLQVMHSIGSAPVLVAHSLGGAVVQRIWQQHPDRIKAVVLMASSPPYGMAREWMKVLLRRFRTAYQLHLFNAGKLKEPPAGVATMFFSAALPVEKRQQYMKLLQPESLKAAEAMVRQNLDLESLDMSIPLLVLGSKADQFFSARLAANIASAYHTQPVIFPDLCHDMMLDPCWQVVADSILAFLQKAVL